MIPLEQRAGFEAEMREAEVDWQMHVYGNTVHSFTNRQAAIRGMPEALRYSPEADARSWASLRALFSEALDPAPGPWSGSGRAGPCGRGGRTRATAARPCRPGPVRPDAAPRAARPEPRRRAAG